MTNAAVPGVKAVKGGRQPIAATGWLYYAKQKYIHPSIHPSIQPFGIDTDVKGKAEESDQLASDVVVLYA